MWRVLIGGIFDAGRLLKRVAAAEMDASAGKRCRCRLRQRVDARISCSGLN
jgi:hypothetical protein